MNHHFSGTEPTASYRAACGNHRDNAEIAQRAGVKTLVLTHMLAQIDQPGDPRADRPRDPAGLRRQGDLGRGSDGDCAERTDRKDHRGRISPRVRPRGRRHRPRDRLRHRHPAADQPRRARAGDDVPRRHDLSSARRRARCSRGFPVDLLRAAGRRDVSVRDRRAATAPSSGSSRARHGSSRGRRALIPWIVFVRRVAAGDGRRARIGRRRDAGAAVAAARRALRHRPPDDRPDGGARRGGRQLLAAERARRHRHAGRRRAAASRCRRRRCFSATSPTTSRSPS